MSLVRTAAAGLALCAMIWTGCGGPPPLGPTVEGKLTKDGKPLPLRPMVGYITMNLVPVDQPTADPQSASFLKDKTDGSFRIGGTQGLGVKPGKYRMVVQHFEDGTEKDALGGKFSKTTSPITLDVSPAGGVQKFDVELSKFAK